VAFGFGTSYAFHDGGVAECTGCHSMHSALSSSYLLVGTDQGSTCLSCHENAGDTGPRSYHISTPSAELALSTDIPVQRTPGGEFGWLRQNLSAPASYSAYAIIRNWGYERGHNIQATDNGYTIVDGTSSPGGAAPADELTCISCHDPHSRARRLEDNTIVYPQTLTPYEPIVEAGSYGHVPAPGEAVGVYRLLGGDEYAAYGSTQFPGVPAAVVPSSYNRTEATTQTRVAYGYGTANGYASWSNWCGTCHDDMHDPGSPLVHETEAALGGTIATQYNEYVMTGDLTGIQATAYTSLVPFALSTDDPTILDDTALTDDTDLNGPVGADRLACLTCHRAHASGWRFALRWNGEAEFLTLGTPGVPIYPGVELSGTIGNQGQFNRGYTSAQMAATYNDRPATVFSQHQRSYCNKCHQKD
jgi:predicted CXXCH cytochrome family protein